MTDLFTRGGQLTLHKYRMFKQICILTVLLSFLVGVGAFGVLFYGDTTPYQRQLYLQYLHAEFLSNLNGPENAPQAYRSYNRAHVHYVDRIARQNVWRSFWYVLAATIMLIGYFIVGGYLKSRKQLKRGARIVFARKLKRIIKRSGQASDLNLDGLPLIKDKETSHILITGTTGSGKTNCLHTLLPQIRKRPNPAIIVDLTGDFVARYYRPDHDLILNPFDERSQAWSPWGECLTDTHYDQLAAAIIPKSTSHDKFWENAGKALLAAALKKLAHQPDIQKLYDTLVRDDLNKFSKFFRGTDAAPYTHQDGERMTLSIRATLANHLQSFKYLKGTKHPFSIRKWITNPTDQWLFLCANPDQRETLRPLISCWLDTASNALMTLQPDLDRRLWFIIDELPALQKLPSLETMMAESRKYGGCVMAGVQSFPQLTNTYGYNQAQSILDLFNTKIFFRNTDPNTTQWISKVLGEAETTEQIENLSYGANTIRDGVSLSQHTQTKPLILPTEIANLNDLEAYIRLPSGLPVGNIQLKYKPQCQFIPFSKNKLT